MRISIYEVQEMNYLDYLQIRKDAFIDKLSSSSEGREYLKEAWRLSQTKPDRKTSRELFGGRSVCG